MNSLAPIIVFAYNRPDHLKSCLVHLSKNELAEKCSVYIFCDGPKKDANPEELNSLFRVREIATRDYGFANKQVIIRAENLGLAENVISGIDQILEFSDRVIVLEDDIITGPHFLEFMNKGLDFYKNTPEVFGISGYCYPVDEEISASSFLLPIACSWSYAIWKSSWTKVDFDVRKLLDRIEAESKETRFDFGGYPFYQMLKDFRDGLNNSWAIRFYASMFLEEAYFLYPNQSLASNIGFDRSGVHCGPDGYFSDVGLSSNKVLINPGEKRLDPKIVDQFERSFQNRTKSKTPKMSGNHFKKRIKKLVKRVLGIRPGVTKKESRPQKKLNNDDERFVYGQMMSRQTEVTKPVESLSKTEFKVFSQWGDDGIIDYLTRYLNPPKRFIEFGVEDYLESNTRFLMMNQNWSGLVMDGSTSHIQAIKSSSYFWKYDLRAKKAFITAENIDQLIEDEGFDGQIGLLHIDIDGNDYWVWKAISVADPVIAIIEYNSVFGSDKTITIPYAPDFYRTSAHYSNLFAGASLAALVDLGKEKGYVFLGCNSAGNNAYFVKEGMQKDLKSETVESGFVASRFRESRDPEGNLTYLSHDKRLEEIRGLEVFNTRSQQIERL